MFSNCAKLTTAPSILPATNLNNADNCYDGMFSGCICLTNAPKLPATTLSTWCYCSMFRSCESLKIPPALPATTLTYNCYASMFTRCSSLIAVPALPATTLAEGCYLQMFYKCQESLWVSDSPEGSATIAWRIPTSGTFSNTYTYSGMFTDGISGTRSTPSPTFTAGSYKIYYTNNTPIK